MQMKVQLATMPLVRRYTHEKDTHVVPVYRVTSTARILLNAGVTEPTHAQMSAAYLIVLCHDRGDHLTSAADIDFISGDVDAFELLIPELRRRQVFDRYTIEMLLNSSTTALRDGEL
jgi:hypothetical protein